VPARAADEQVFKIATLAPEGSTWWKLFVDFDKNVKAATNNRVKFKIYAGGVAGDEPDFVRKMRVGGLQGAAVTSVGLAEIQPALMALQAPGLFNSWDELDAVRAKLADQLAKLLAEKGYVVLFWGDVGFNRIFSQVKVETPADAQKTKMWLWTQDNVHKVLWETAGVKTVPLGVPDVLPSLQSGLIDAIPAAPLAAVSLQWFSRTKFMLDLPYNVTIGAFVVSSKALDKLSAEDKAALMKIAASTSVELSKIVRADDKKALDAIKKAGVQVTVPSDAAKKQWAELCDKAADAAAGPVYPKELLTQAREAVKAYRAAGGK
jgi:TRAP-type C4-dicarboxylate transport system substrate-binding protein